jgi:quaternary ammonium compound-resistance protein SugE
VVWVLLFVTGMLEVVWATAAGYSEGFTKLVPSLVVVAVMPFTFYLLSVVMRRLPAGTAYAIWTSIGTAGTAVLGVLAFGDPANLPRLGGLALVIAGVVMLRMADGRGQPKEKAGA